MSKREAIPPLRRWLVGAVLGVVLASCGSGSSQPPASGLPGATSFAEFRADYCAAWESIFRGYGNPDTAGLSDMARSFEAAIQSGDAAAIDAAADEILEELEAGRAAAAAGAAWAPATAGMTELGRLVVAFERMVEAQRDAATQGPTAARDAGQAAFEAAGALDAWGSLLAPETWAAVTAARPPDTPYANCGDLPIGM